MIKWWKKEEEVSLKNHNVNQVRMNIIWTTTKNDEKEQLNNEIKVKRERAPGVAKKLKTTFININTNSHMHSNKHTNTNQQKKERINSNKIICVYNK